MTGTGERSDDPASERIRRLLDRAREERKRFDPPADPDERAVEYLRDGLWPAIETYIDVVSDGGQLDPDDHERLEAALNCWLELYARCYGVDLDAEFSVREAATTFVETHSIRDTAQLLTNVPDRSRERRER